MTCGENASYDVVNAENRLDFIHYPLLLYSYSITLYRELTDDLYATVQDTPQDIKVINLPSVQYICFFQPYFN